MTDVQVKRKKLADYILNPENPVGHSDRNKAVVIDSIKEVGAFRSGGASKGKMLAGNLTLDAMAAAGIEDVIEITTDGKTWVVVNRDDMSPEQEKKAAYYDQQGAMLASWDASQIAADLEAGIDLSTMFQPEELSALLTQVADEMIDKNMEPPEPQDDRAAELQAEWKTAEGQMWALGNHRLICGDCTDNAVIERVMGGEKAGLLVTSPPYFNQREYSQWQEYADYLAFAGQCVARASEAMGEDAVFALNIGSDEPARRWMPSDWWVILRDAGFLYRECIAWVKAAAVWSVPRSMHIENGHYFPAQRWEVVLIVSRGNHPKFDIADRDKVREFDENVWQIGVVTGGEQKALGHFAPFPVEIPERLVMAYTQRDAVVYEPFSGSGTTLVACEKLGRQCRAVEIAPQYVAVALERWHQMTGQEPRLL